MGKKDKAQADIVGRVPLVQDGRPLLYTRYNNVEEILRIGKSDELKNGDAGGAAGERPSKKQKRAAAAAPGADGPADGEKTANAPASKVYGVVGEDGLTYKQRRQMRRAAERAAKAQAEAEVTAAAAAAGGAAADGVAGADGALQPATAAAAPEPAGGNNNDRKKDKKNGKKKDKRGRGEEAEEVAAAEGGAGASVAATAAAAPAGNAEEAARIRVVLGFTSAPGGGGGRGLSLAALAVGGGTTPAAAAAAAADNGSADPSAETAFRSAKRQKRDKKDKRGKRKVEDEGCMAAKEPEAMEAAAAPTGGKAPDAAAANKDIHGNSSRSNKTAAGGTQFSFNFKIQPEVEAETEAKLARLMALDSTKDGFVPRRVWVSGLPHEFDEDTVREYWGYCGEVEAMHLLTFPDSGNFNGTAFITFKAQEGYEAALACHGEMLQGRQLRVEKCKAAAELKGKARGFSGAANGDGGGAAATPKAGAKAAPAPTTTATPGGRVTGYPVAYVGNIAFEASVEELQQLFAGAGAVPSKVRLHTDKATGRPKGFAHVHFDNDEGVDKAVALDGTNFHGRKIRVSYAQPKQGEVPA